MVAKVGVNVQERNGATLEHEELAEKDDYLYAGGIAFEGLDDYLIEKVGGIIKRRIPNHSIGVCNDEKSRRAS